MNGRNVSTASALHVAYTRNLGNLTRSSYAFPTSTLEGLQTVRSCPSLRYPIGLMHSRALDPLKYGDALWSILFVLQSLQAWLISIVGNLVLSIATSESDQAMSATLVGEGSTFSSLLAHHWDRGYSVPTFLSPSNL